MGRRWSKENVYYLLGVYHTPEKMDVRFEDRVFIEDVLARKDVPYVENPAEKEIYSQLDRSRLLVVRGPKGDGLSVATGGRWTHQRFN